MLIPPSADLLNHLNPTRHIDMIFLRLLPVFLSFLLAAAHFYRADGLTIAFLCLSAPALLLFKRKLCIRIVQALLMLCAAEWIRTLFVLVQLRQQMELPWERLALILGAVALFTAVSTLLFRLPSLRNRYGI
jgi:hypothetical protein